LGSFVANGQTTQQTLDNMSKKEKEKPIRLSGYIEEKHTISKMCDECSTKCTSIMRRKNSSLCKKVYDSKQRQRENWKLRIIKELFNNVTPNQEILNEIDNYIHYCDDAIDGLSTKELNDDYEDFISK
jgi:hypothetical protein